MVIAIIHHKIPRQFTKAQLTQICIYIKVCRATVLLSRPSNHTLGFMDSSSGLVCCTDNFPFKKLNDRIDMTMQTHAGINSQHPPK